MLQVLKVAILAEKYAVDYSWYVDTILNLIRIAGDYVSEEVWYRVIQIVINRDDVQGYAAKTVFEVTGENNTTQITLIHDVVIEITVRPMLMAGFLSRAAPETVEGSIVSHLQEMLTANFCFKLCQNNGCFIYFSP